MVRNILAVIAGLFIGMVVNIALVMLNAYVLYPMPPGMDMNDPDQLNAYIATLPTLAFFPVLAAHLGQSFVGGWAAARIGSSRPMLLAMIVGVLTMIAGIMNWMTVDGPTWMMIEIPLYLVVAWAAGRMEQRRRATVHA